MTWAKWFSALLALIFLASCAQQADDAERSAEDRYMSEARYLNRDWELRNGDKGVERRRGIGIRSAGNMQAVYPNPDIIALNGDYANNVIEFGKMWLGTPYEYGSDRDDPSTFDCSDFTRYVYLASLGMDIPKDSRSQAAYVKQFGIRQYTSLADAMPGDLLFFMEYRGTRPENYSGFDKSRQTITHCGIYLGGGEILHTASKRTGGVRIDSMWGKHLEYRFVSGGGILP